MSFWKAFSLHRRFRFIEDFAKFRHDLPFIYRFPKSNGSLINLSLSICSITFTEIGYCRSDHIYKTLPDRVKTIWTLDRRKNFQLTTSQVCWLVQTLKPLPTWYEESKSTYKSLSKNNPATSGLCDLKYVVTHPYKLSRSCLSTICKISLRKVKCLTDPSLMWIVFTCPIWSLVNSYLTKGYHITGSSSSSSTTSMNELSSAGKSMFLETLFLAMLFWVFPEVEEETLEEGNSETGTSVYTS